MSVNLCGAELCGYGCELPSGHSGKHAAVVGSIAASPGWPMDLQEIRTLTLERDGLAAVSRTLREALEAVDGMCEDVFAGSDDVAAAMNDISRTVSAALGSQDGAEL